MFRLYRSANIPSINKIFARFVSSNLREAVKYLSLKYGVKLTPEGVIACSILLSVLASSLIAVLIQMVSANSLLSILVSILTIFALYTYLSSYIINIYEVDRLTYSRYAYLVLREVGITLSATKSLHDALLFLAQGSYPEISHDARFLILNIVNGLPPQKVLRKYAHYQPSSTLRSGLVLLSYYPERSINLSSICFKPLSEVKEQIKKLNSKLELYCLIIIVQSFLVPITYFLTSLLLIRQYTLIDPSLLPLFFVLSQLIVLSILMRSFISRLARVIG